MRIRGKTRRSVQWLMRRGQKGHLEKCLATMTLDQLEDSRRPLLFSLLPRMLRRDGTTPKLLQDAFAHLDQGGDRASAIMISSERWSRALATSRMLAARRAAADRHR